MCDKLNLQMEIQLSKARTIKNEAHAMNEIPQRMEHPSSIFL